MTHVNNPILDRINTPKIDGKSVSPSTSRSGVHNS